MTPPQEQLHVQALWSAGIFPSVTLVAPGTQGVVTGTQGIGVSTPRAAAVAAATVGFDGVVHMMKDGMFAIGAQSMMVAAGTFETFTIGVGVTTRVAGPVPNVHTIAAPMTTCSGMFDVLY